VVVLVEELLVIWTARSRIPEIEILLRISVDPDPLRHTWWRKGNLGLMEMDGQI
jgi:hypothetical protein